MNREEQRQLLAEQTALRRFIAEIPATDVLDRDSFEARLRSVQQRLAEVQVDTRAPARARLTFRGRPVIGSHGIFAEFGMSATKAFTDAVAMVAAGFGRELAGTEPIPDRDQCQLLITSTAVGSFGFELEEHLEQPLLLDDESVVAQALTQTQELLAATTGSDDELTEAVAGIDPRVVSALRGFLEKLADNDAVCAMEYGDRRLGFRDVAQVRRGAERLAAGNRHEESTRFKGAFQGVLPKRRTFEFKRSGDDVVIVGKIGSDIANPDVLNRHLHECTEIEVVATRLGNGHPRYVLNQEPEWTGRADSGAGEQALWPTGGA